MKYEDGMWDDTEYSASVKAAWRTEVIERNIVIYDNMHPTCEWCKRPAEFISHVVSIKMNPVQALFPSNGICVCKECL